MANIVPLGIKAVAEGTQKFATDLKKMNTGIQRVGKSAGKLTKSIAKAGVAVAKFGIAAGAAAVAGIAAIGVLSIKTAISVESAFAGVAKTTDGLIDEFGKMTDAGEEVFQSFRNLAKEVPIAVEELLAIGELAGQLGVPKEALVDFTETVAALGVTTNLTQEAAATALAQIANIFQVSADDMAQNTSQVGSALVELGNNFATTEADILTFAQRIAGAGNIAGLTQADILGIGAAFSSVGIEAESGGTAVQKVLLAMVEAVTTGSEELDIFGKTVGKTAQEFAKDFEEDAAGAFEQFVLALGDAGDDAIGILAELGLQDQRLVRAFLSLSNAGDVLTRTMDSANIGFEENTALTEEAAKRYQTTESQLKILKNTLRDVGITIGSALLPFLNKMLKFAKPLIDKFGKSLPKFLDKFTAAIERITSAVNDIVFGEVNLEDILPPFLQKIWEDFIGVLDKFRKWWDRNGTFIKLQAKRIFDAIINTLTTLAESIIPFVIQQFDKISDWFDEHEDGITGAIANIADFFENTLGPAVATLWTNVLQPFFGDFITGVLDIAGVLIDVFGGRKEEFFDVGLGVVSKGPGAEGQLMTLLEGLNDIFKDFFVNKFPEHFKNFRDFVLKFFGLSNWEEVADSWRGIWTNLETILQTWVENVTTLIESTKQLIIDFATDVATLSQALRGDPSAIFKLLGGGLFPSLEVPSDARPGGPKIQPTSLGLPQEGPAIMLPPIAPLSTTSTETNEFNLTVNTSAQVEPILQDFRLMRAMGGRV